MDLSGGWVGRSSTRLHAPPGGRSSLSLAHDVPSSGRGGQPVARGGGTGGRRRYGGDAGEGDDDEVNDYTDEDELGHRSARRGQSCEQHRDEGHDHRHGQRRGYGYDHERRGQDRRGEDEVFGRRVEHGSSNAFASGASQNTGNVLTNRSSTRVHAPPGGASSLSLAFGGPDPTAHGGEGGDQDVGSRSQRQRYDSSGGGGSGGGGGSHQHLGGPKRCNDGRDDDQHLGGPERRSDGRGGRGGRDANAAHGAGGRQGDGGERHGRALQPLSANAGRAAPPSEAGLGIRSLLLDPRKNCPISEAPTHLRQGKGAENPLHGEFVVRDSSSRGSRRRRYGGGGKEVGGGGGYGGGGDGRDVGSRAAPRRPGRVAEVPRPIPGLEKHYSENQRRALGMA